MVSQLSLEAWLSVQVDLNARQRLVYDAIQFNNGATDQEISKLTGLPINCVTPRRGELCKMELIEEDMIVLSTTGRRTTRWRKL